MYTHISTKICLHIFENKVSITFTVSAFNDKCCLKTSEPPLPPPPGERYADRATLNT